MNTFVFLLAAIAVLGPSGEKVCDMTLPALPQGARVETTNLENAVAWRIRFDGEGERRITDEDWVFDFGADLRCWPVSHAQGEYVPKTLSTISQMAPRPDFAPVAAGIGEMHNYATHFPGTAESPLVVEGPGFVAAIGDAGCLDYARIRFASGEKPGTVKTVLEGETFVKVPYVTPWRYIHVAKDAAALANAQPALMDALNAPARIADTSWIKPGKVLRVAKLDTDCGKAAVDFVKRNNMQYIELDCGWYGQEHTGDPLKPGLAPERVAKGEKFDFFEILRYAKEKDVGVILYVNREPLKKNRDAILDQLVKWGVKGVKYGFVNVGSQEWRAWVTEAIAAAAERKLLVDIHDEYRLTGIQKTYPNVMTVEGICGNEEMPNAAHDCALPFTRFLDGPGDYTPCWNNGRVKNTLAHQLALPCVYTSGWQFLFWYSRPEQIPEKDPALDFWRELPASFDETRFLQGEIGKFAVVARRKGRTWYVAGINGLERRAFTMDTSFLGAGEWKCRLFRDADPAIESGLGKVTVESVPVAPTMTVEAAARGGFAAIFEPVALPNGGVWKDTEGVHINAHGGGLLKDGDVWYWYGEHKVEGKAGNRAQVGVGCYSSRDLVTWKNEGISLKVSDAEGHDIEKDCILERPKVVKAPATGKYVMLFHLERKGRGYNDARAGFAVADRPAGPFKFVKSLWPNAGQWPVGASDAERTADAIAASKSVGPVSNGPSDKGRVSNLYSGRVEQGQMCRDMTLFVDDDGSVWHVFASESNSTLHFTELTGDCLGYTGRWYRGAEKDWTEAPAVVKHGGWYWLLGSSCTGWKPNAARIYRAKSLAGPWEWMGNPCTGVNGANMLGADKTWGGQSTFIFHDDRTGRDVACFDIWQPSNAIDGRYVWLPITWHGDGLPEIPWRGEWSANDRDDLTLRGGPNSIWGVYQWGVEVDGFVHKETKKPARAYLWIPPGTKRVESVVIGNDNMLEETLFSDADFRRTLAAADVAIVFVTPGLMGFNEKFTEAEVPALDALLAKLAKASGHEELVKDAKIVPLGHSAWADWPYLCTAAMPQRVRCAVSLKGSWPHFKPQFDDAFWKKTEGVPMLLVGGDYEWFSERMEKDKGFLKSHPDVKLYPVADWESGHFDMTDALPLGIAEFIAKGTVPKIPRFGGKFTVLGFNGRDDEILKQDPKNHLQVTVPFQPSGEGFRAKAVFDDKVPPGRPERWTGKKAGEANDRPEMPREAIDVKVVQGPAVKTGMETFDVRFNRHGFDGYRAREVVLAAVYPGDAHWRRSVQQAILRFPVNTHGAENSIEWNPPKSAKVADFPLKLDAKSTSGLPVRYFVREGPAVVGDDGVLRLCDWPSGAKSCDITICAYQWGADGGKVKTAEPIWAQLTVSR